jgi:hypothetical protein
MTSTLIVDRCKVLDRDIEKFRRLSEIADDPLALGVACRSHRRD